MRPRNHAVSPRIDEWPRRFPSPEGCEIIKPGGVSPRSHGREPQERRPGRRLPPEPRRVRDHKAWRREPQESRACAQESRA